MIVVEPSQHNQYLIKSLLNNQYFTLDKQDSIKYQQTSKQCNQEFHWTIVSVDQQVRFEGKYSLRFGEFIQITPNQPQNQNKLLNNVNLLIQQSDTSIISEQTFKRLNDNLVRKQPCVLQRSDDNFYLTIEKEKTITLTEYIYKSTEKEKITFLEFPNPGSYFQIIPLNENELVIDRPIIQFHYEFEIRNYVTGYSLNINNDPVNTPNPLLSAIRSNKKNEKWQIQNTYFHNQFSILNLSSENYIHTEGNLLETYAPNINWEIQTIDQKVLSYGVPFIIQNSSTKQFLTMNILNLKEILNFQQDVYQSEKLMPTSLWIIFQHQL